MIALTTLYRGGTSPFCLTQRLLSIYLQAAIQTAKLYQAVVNTISDLCSEVAEERLASRVHYRNYVFNYLISN